jgi:hypothetical protein
LLTKAKLFISTLLILTAVVFAIPISAAGSNAIFYEVIPQDDARVTFNGTTWDYGNDYVQVGYFDANHYQMQSGMRFNNIQIPAGATITNAYITFTASNTDAVGTVNSVIWGQANGSYPYSSYSDFISRTPTANSVPWNISEQWQKGSMYKSPDLSIIIKEITGIIGGQGVSVNLLWGTSVAAYTTSTPGLCRRAYSFTSGGQQQAPTLTLVFDGGAVIAPVIPTIPTLAVSPVVTATPDNRIDKLVTSSTDISKSIAALSAKLDTAQTALTSINSKLLTINDPSTQVNAIQSSVSNLINGMTTIKTDVATLTAATTGTGLANKTINDSVNALKMWILAVIFIMLIGLGSCLYLIIRLTMLVKPIKPVEEKKVV